MGFGLLWPLVLLVLVPIIILLYILKQEARPKPFSSTMLWNEVFQNVEATKPWEKLKKNLLLLLQLLVVLVLILAMMGPWLRTKGNIAKQSVLVIDNSASMGADYDGEHTRLEAAKDAACDYIDSLPANAVVHVIVANQQSLLLLSNCSDLREAKSRIRSIEQTSLAGTAAGALGLVQSCAGQAENSDVIFFTDTAFDPGGIPASVASFYSDTDNVSVDAVNYVTKDGQLLVLASLTNRVGPARDAEVNLYGVREDGSRVLLDIAPVSFGSENANASAYFTLDAAGLEGVSVLEAELNGADGLQGDNRAQCVLEASHINRVLLVTESNLFIEKAFVTLPGIDLYRTSEAGVLDGKDMYDLYIFDGVVPEDLPDSGSMLFINCKETALFSATETVERVRLSLMPSNVCRYVDGTVFGVNQAYVYDLPVWADAFVRQGESFAGFYGICDGQRIAVLGLDLHQTDFALTAEYPVLVSNLCEFLVDTGFTEKDTYVAGESVILHGRSGQNAMTLRTPDGSVETIPALEAQGAYLQVTQPGVYTVSQEIDQEVKTQFFTVMFPCAYESKVTSAETMLAESGTATKAEIVTGTRELQKLVLILVLLLLAAEWIVYTKTQYTKTRSRKIGAVIVRLGVVALVLCALFDVHISRKSNQITTIFVVDCSDSMKDVIAEEESFVQQAIAAMPKGNSAGIVTFGSDAQIEQFVSDKKAFTNISSHVNARATNLEQAVSTAIALFPDESAKRLVLLTDGAQNEGDISNLVPSFAGTDIELKVAKFESSIADEVYVSDVRLPEKISEGDSFRVYVDIYSTGATEAVVSLYSGRTLKAQKDVILQKGSNQLVFADQGVETGLKSYRVTVDAKQDTVSLNNMYSAFTTVSTAPRLLVVEGTRDESLAFQSLLDACNYSFDVVTPSGVPGNVSDMLRYQSVILVDVYADDLREGFMETLRTYVKDYAGGQAVLGGKDSYALGNYRSTALEELLPVNVDLIGEKQVPKLAMVMVIDHSGSMSSSSTDRGGATCMDVAKQAAVNALDSLRIIDEVGVLAFDDSYTWVVPLQTAEDTAKIAGQIGTITSDGGTSIYPAVDAAAEALLASDAGLKHIILLTDGQDGYGAYDPLLEKLNENGITLSSVAIGSGADTKLLEGLASRGGGRYYYSDAGTSLPRIFAQEVFLSAQSYLINEEFFPVITSSHEILSGVFDEGCPSLLGYIATSPKATANILMETHRADPLLAIWQCGLGRTVAWTSDGSGEWTGNFSGWDNYAALWRNLLDWTITDAEPGSDSISIAQKGNSAVITYDTQSYSAATEVAVLVTDEEGNQQELLLTAIAPGRFEATLPLGQTGVYSVSLRNYEGDTLVKYINTATAVQYSQEYRFDKVSGDLDAFIGKVSGRVIGQVYEVYDTQLNGAVKRMDLRVWFLLAAALVFLLDILLRRMHMDWLQKLLCAGESALSRMKRFGTLKSAVIERSDNTEKTEREQVTVHRGETERTGDEPAAPHTAAEAGHKESERTENARKERLRKEKPRKAEPAQTPGVIDAAALLKKKKERDL